MAKLARFRGDTYAMEWFLKIDGVAADLTNVDSSTFYYDKNGTPISISGTVTGAPTDGQINFTPGPTDFDTAGTFPFDIQVLYLDGSKRTFIKDTIEIVDDLNKA